MNGRLLNRAGFGAALLVLGACSGDVAVQAQIQMADSTIYLADLEVRALPYDRDAIFDSLAGAHARPEPVPPDSLVDLRDAIAAANQMYAEQTTRWGAARDSLQKINDALEGLQRGSGPYRLLYIEWQAQSQIETQAQRAMNAAFQNKTDLESRYRSQAAQFTMLRDQWGEEAFGDFGEVVAIKVERLGREEVYDTTDANGLARFSLRTGDWWIHARYSLPFDELYWNEPVTVQRGEPVTLILNRENAELRPRY